MKGFDMAVITPEIKEFIQNNLGWIDPLVILYP